MKILLVEDDVNLREIVQRSLEQERYIVEVAPDFRTGIQKIEDYNYDCILLDIMLPMVMDWICLSSSKRCVNVRM